MGIAARKIQNERLLNLKPNERLFGINSGMGWSSDNVTIVRKVTTVKVFPGDVVLRHARPLHAAPPGWPDLCGWETITITEEMVGTQVALFVAEEIKAGNDRMRPAQKAFQKIITGMGGIYRIITGKD